MQAHDGFWVGAWRDSPPSDGQLLQRYRACADDPATVRSHLIGDRHENTYIHRRRLPELEPILAAASQYAAGILGVPVDTVEPYYWFNEMHPGDRTGTHTHAGTEERLSGVYYVQVPPHSGDLLITVGERRARLQPRAGLFVFFAPETPHGVTRHEGTGMRLSLGLNFSQFPAKRR